MRIEILKKIVENAVKESFKRNCGQIQFVCEELGLTPSEVNKILRGNIMPSVDLGYGKELSVCFDSEYREIVIGVMKNGLWTQDIAQVGQNYTYDENDEVKHLEGYNVKVWGDDYNEDYTEEIQVGEWEGEE